MKPRVYPLPDGMPLELVSEAYERGGLEQVVLEMGLEDWPQKNLDKLLARALAEFPVDYDKIEVIEGLHDGLMASAVHGSLTSGNPELRQRGAELQMRRKGLLKGEKDGAQAAMEALLEVTKILAGQTRHENVVIDVESAPQEAYEFPKPHISQEST